MKTVFTLICICLSLLLQAQNNANIVQIDSIVNSINSVTINIRRDTLKQDNAQLGFSMRTYLTSVTKDGIFVKYSNNVHTNMSQGGISKSFISTNTFYYHNRKLIKVEENMTEGEKKIEGIYYYDDDKLIHFTPDMPQFKQRGEELVLMSKAMFGK